MYSIVTFIVVVGAVLGFLGVSLAVTLSRTPTTARAGRFSYPADPDPEAWLAEWPPPPGELGDLVLTRRRP